MTQAEGRNREPSCTGCSTRLSQRVSLNDLPCLAHQGARQRRPLARIEVQALLAVQREASTRTFMQHRQHARSLAEGGSRDRECSTKGVSQRPTLSWYEPSNVHQATQACPEQEGASPQMGPREVPGDATDSLRSTTRIIDGNCTRCQYPKR